MHWFSSSSPCMIGIKAVWVSGEAFTNSTEKVKTKKSTTVIKFRMLRVVWKLLHKAGSFYVVRIETELLLDAYPKTSAESAGSIYRYLESNLCRGSNSRASKICILELESQAAETWWKGKSVAGHWDSCFSREQVSLAGCPSHGWHFLSRLYAATVSDLVSQLLSAPAFHITSIFCSLDQKTYTYMMDRALTISTADTSVPTWAHSRLLLQQPPLSPSSPPQENMPLLFIEWVVQGGKTQI